MQMRNRTCVFTKNTENGSALLYVLFIVVFMGIVLSLLLTTVTQGQRNIENFEQKLTEDYLVEAAYEIIIGWMEQDEDTDDVYNYIMENIGSDSGDQRLYEPMDNVEVIAQIQEHNTEEETIQMLLYKAEEETLADKTLYRVITATNTNDWNYPEPPPIPEDDEGVAEEEKTGAISYTEAGVQQTFTIDCLQNGTCMQDLGQSNGDIDVGDEYLYIPEAIGTLEMENQVPVNYNADRGIIIGANMETQAANADITLTSCNGNIEIVGASFSTGTGQTYIVMQAGGSIIGGCTVVNGETVCTSMTAGRDVTLSANHSIIVPGTSVSSNSRNIYVNYNEAFNVDSATNFDPNPIETNFANVCP